MDFGNILKNISPVYDFATGSNGMASKMFGGGAQLIGKMAKQGDLPQQQLLGQAGGMTDARKKMMLVNALMGGNNG